MSTINLPERIILPRDPERRSVAIATIVVYGIFLPATWVVEYAVVWKTWSSKKRRRTPWRVGLAAFVDFLSLLCLIRVIGNALYLAYDAPSRSVFVVETLFSSLGFLPLLMKLIFILTRITRRTSEDKPLKAIRFGFIAMRATLLLGVVLIIIGACILFLPLWKAGSIVLIVAFVGVTACHLKLLSMTSKKNISFDLHQRHGIVISSLALPAILIRAVYLALIEFSHDEKYNPITGNPGYCVGMVFIVEIIVMTLFLIATSAAEAPLFGKEMSESGPMEVIQTTV